MIAIVSFLLLSAASVLDASPVVYGTDVTTVKYPYLVYLEITGLKVEICGGTLIGLKTILTAAHCLDGIGITTIEVVAGILDLRQTMKQNRTTTLYKIHERYQPMVEADPSRGITKQEARNDLGLVWITTAFTPSKNVKVASLPNSNPIREREFLSATLTFMGWGSSETGRDENQLKEGPSKFISTKKCKKNHNILENENLICVEKTTTATVCFGDSGGPLVYKNQPIAVASFIVSSEGTEEEEEDDLPATTIVPRRRARSMIQKKQTKSKKTTTTTTTTTTTSTTTTTTTTTTTPEPSAEFSCRSEDASLFTNIFPYVPWIRLNMNPPIKRKA